MISSVSKEEVLTCVRVHSHGNTRSKYYGAITKRMNFICPVAETTSSIEPKDNNLELNAISYTFSKIDSNRNFNNSFGDRELLTSVSWVFPQRRTRKLKKITLFLLWKIPLCCGGIQEHKNRREGERKGPNRQRSETWKSIVKTKHSSLTSLAFI